VYKNCEGYEISHGIQEWSRKKEGSGDFIGFSQ